MVLLTLSGTLCLDIKNLSLPTVSATHKETKQFFTLYNTLDDKKVYLEKEVRETFHRFF